MLKRKIKGTLFRNAAKRALRRRLGDKSQWLPEPRRRAKTFCEEMDEILEWTRQRQGV